MNGPCELSALARLRLRETRLVTGLGLCRQVTWLQASGKPGWPFCQEWQFPPIHSLPQHSADLHHLFTLQLQPHPAPATDKFCGLSGNSQHGFPREWAAGAFSSKQPFFCRDLADLPQSIAAATTDLWPSMANTLMIPWRASTHAPQPPKLRSAAPQAKSSPTAIANAKDNSSLNAQTATVARAKTELPDFLRDAAPSPRFLDRRLANATPINIFSELSNMSPRSLAVANPLMRRSYAALMARPLTTLPGLRSMSTYQPSRMQQFSWINTPSPLRNMQSRSFGTGGVPRDLLANREAAANRNPTSATAQNSFYQLLLKANMPAIVVERYQSGRSNIVPGLTMRGDTNFSK